MSAKPLALVTGATGHIGFRTLATLLQAGYRARITSRSFASADKLKHLPSIQPYANELEVIEVPDFLAEGAFNEAVKGVDFILHIASPIFDPALDGTKFDVDVDFVQPAIQGTVGILKTAAKEPSVKRVVITSSIAILALGSRKDGDEPIGPDDLAPAPSRAEMEADVTVAYRGSKIVANEAAERWVAENNPGFDVVHVLPGYVQGRNETLETLDDLVNRVSSNKDMLQYVQGGKTVRDHPTNMVLVDDVAAVEVAALDSKKASHGERFIASPPRPIGDSYSAIDEHVRKLFPDAVKSGVLPLGGSFPGGGVPMNTSKTTERLGIEFHGVDAMVKSLIGQYVELASK